jgi:hypothetical protein
MHPLTSAPKARPHTKTTIVSNEEVRILAESDPVISAALPTYAVFTTPRHWTAPSATPGGQGRIRDSITVMPRRQIIRTAGQADCAKP